MLTASELAELFGPRVRVLAVDLVTSGSSGWLQLEARPGFFETVTVARALRRRGVTLDRGKPAVEELLYAGRTRVHVDHIDDALEGELYNLRVRMTVLPAEAAAE